MKQYCRYCTFCCEGDCYYCTAYDKTLNDEQIKRPNKCKKFAQTDDIITGKIYKPREPKKAIQDRGDDYNGSGHIQFQQGTLL